MFRWILTDILVILIFIEIVQMWFFGKQFTIYLGLLGLFAFIMVMWYVLGKAGILPGDSQ